MRRQETHMPLQPLRVRDPDELAAGFRGWELRFRQLGGGSFRGELEFLQLGGTQIIRASGNRRLQAQGSLPPGSFGFAPVLPRNQGAIWRGRRCQTGQVVTIDPGQEGDHLSAADYWMVGLTVDGDLFRECAAVLGGFDPDERLVGRLAVASSGRGRRPSWRPSGVSAAAARRRRAGCTRWCGGRWTGNGKVGRNPRTPYPPPRS